MTGSAWVPTAIRGQDLLLGVGRCFPYRMGKPGSGMLVKRVRVWVFNWSCIWWSIFRLCSI